MKKTIITAGLVLAGLSIQAQDVKIEEPKGKAIMHVFAYFHSGLTPDNNDLGFELERSYLGYEYKVNEALSIKGVLDIGKSNDVDDYHRIAYIKNAQISWKKGSFTLNGGMISTTQFNYQEKFWGYRYLMKSFQDKYKYGSSADLGVSAAYQFADWISADAIIVNGEGYKKIQKKDGLNYGLGLTITPIKGLSIRVYGALNQSVEEGEKDIINLASFVGYRTDRFRMGIEYDMMQNSAYMADADQSGLSVFGAVSVTKNLDIFARFDDQYSRNDWNKAKEAYSAILGTEFRCGKHVKITPNFRMDFPKTGDTKAYQAAYINCYFGF